MSPDWVLVPLLALGHLAIAVYLVNVVLALGFKARGMDRLKRAVALGLLAVSASIGLEVSRGGWSAWSWPLRAYAVICVGTIGVVVPLSCWRLHARREPDGNSERSDETDLAAGGAAADLVGPGAHAWLLRIPGNEALRLRKREWHVSLPSLPAAWDGLSLVHLTDLHFAPCYDVRFFERVLDEAAAWEADLVVFTGDLVDHDAALEWIVPVMSRVRGRLGSLAILGNHDYDHQPADVRRRLVEAGYHDLEGAWQTLEIEGRRLAIGGTSAPWGPRIDLGAFPDADFRLLLSHSPDLFHRAAAAGIDLMLSGHNHGGQIRLPGLGPVFMPSRYSRRFDRGFFRSGRTLLHVAQGVGGKHPIRFGCVPEIGRLVLRCRREHPARPAVGGMRRVLEDAAPASVPGHAGDAFQRR
jgi:predicted MPP superfamily phosphohydrolase